LALAPSGLASHLARADIAVLPYLRSSASGPLHVAMSCGLPVVVSDLPTLAEAAAGYTGAVLVPPADPKALAAGIERARRLTGRRHADARSWTDTVAGYDDLLARCRARR